MAAKPKTYTVSDGQLVLALTEAAEGGFVVTSPLDPELITEAETIGEAFELAREVKRELAESREKLFAQLRPTKSAS
jgi:antitoxin HicB